MVSRRKGHRGTWAPFSPHVSNKPSSQTPSPLILENAPRGIHSHPWGRPREVTREITQKKKGRIRERRMLAKGNPCRRLAAAFHFVFFSSSLSSSTPRPRRLTPTALPSQSYARWGLTKSRVRSIRATRSRGEHRRFPRRAKVTASERELARERRRESPARTLTRGGQLK